MNTISLLLACMRVNVSSEVRVKIRAVVTSFAYVRSTQRVHVGYETEMFRVQMKVDFFTVLGAVPKEFLYSAILIEAIHTEFAIKFLL